MGYCMTSDNSSTLTDKSTYERQAYGHQFLVRLSAGHFRSLHPPPRVAPASHIQFESSVQCRLVGHVNMEDCETPNSRHVYCSLTKGTEQLDIAIISSKGSEAASLWTSYLTTCFQQVAKERSRPPFKLLSVGIEEVVSGVDASQHDSIMKARLQLVILCPSLLSSLVAPGPAALLGSLLQPGRVLAMLLGVTDEAVTMQHRAALLCYDQWQRQVVKDQDPMFVGDFLGTAMDILSRSWQMRHAIDQIHKTENKAQFSISPKKIKVGQNRLLVILVDPLQPTDNVQVTVNKNGEKIDIATFKKRNPYTLQFSVPATCLQVSMLVTVAIEKNGKPLGHRLIKCESRMRELDQLLRSSDNPIQFMCQSLGLSPGDAEQLDMFLAAAFQQNLPPHFNLLRPTGVRHHASHEEYPTLLHFAAKHGLEKLTWQLLECPGGEQASQIRNMCQLTPADMAQRAGHSKLAHMLKSFLQMTELSSMYSYLKGMSEKQPNDLVLNCSNYLLPRPLDYTYSVPPAARPVTSPTSHPHHYTNMDSYQIPPSPVSVSDNFTYNVPPAQPSPLDNYQVPGHAVPYNPPTPSTPSSLEDTLPPGGYMEMQSAMHCGIGMGTANKLRRNMSLNLTDHAYLNCRSECNDIPFHSAEDILACKSSNERHRNSSHSSNSGKSSCASAQDELLEIINDFKNHVFTISEVEKLVENWQNRHDVQQSFKEKEKQLNEMREEYEKIQHSMKTNLKRATPFERIKRFFGRGKKHCKGECNNSSVVGISAATTVSPRPASSLSIHSSCSSTSSGRMSTASGMSLGDSGTHSDSDERKISEVPRHDLRSKTVSGKLYSEIPQRESNLPKHVEEPEQQKLLESTPSGSGVIKPNFFHRSNSIQENTIEEEVDEQYKLSDHKSPTRSVIHEKKEVTTVDVHKTPDDTCRAESLPYNLPLPPADTGFCGNILECNYEDCSKESKTKQSHRLLIIEEGVEKKDFKNVTQSCTAEDILTRVDFDSKVSTTDSKSSGYVKNIINLIETESTFNPSEEADDTCEHLLEEAETEVVFELPDYVNTTSPPVPPRPACENISI